MQNKIPPLLKGFLAVSVCIQEQIAFYLSPKVHKQSVQRLVPHHPGSSGTGQLFCPDSGLLSQSFNSSEQKALWGEESWGVGNNIRIRLSMPVPPPPHLHPQFWLFFSSQKVVLEFF